MRRCSLIATIVELVTAVIEPAITAPFELVDVEYGKIGSDYVLKKQEIEAFSAFFIKILLLLGK